jgi:hypothetical protein
MTKRPGTTSDNGFILKKNFKFKYKYKREKKYPMVGFGNNPIYPLLSNWTSTWTGPEALYE